MRSEIPISFIKKRCHFLSDPRDDRTECETHQDRHQTDLRTIQKNVETMAARFILGGEVHAGSVMVVDTDGNGLTIHTK